MIYLLAVSISFALGFAGLPLWLDILLKIALLPALFGLVLLARIATIKEIVSFVRRR